MAPRDLSPTNGVDLVDLGLIVFVTWRNLCLCAGRRLVTGVLRFEQSRQRISTQNADQGAQVLRRVINTRTVLRVYGSDHQADGIALR
jgi:hypothetical protein